MVLYEFLPLYHTHWCAMQCKSLELSLISLHLMSKESDYSWWGKMRGNNSQIKSKDLQKHTRTHTHTRMQTVTDTTLKYTPQKSLALSINWKRGVNSKLLHSTHETGFILCVTLVCSLGRSLSRSPRASQRRRAALLSTCCSQVCSLFLPDKHGDWPPGWSDECRHAFCSRTLSRPECIPALASLRHI